MSFTPHSSKTPTTFTHLPLELHLQIWDTVLLCPRIVCVTYTFAIQRDALGKQTPGVRLISPTPVPALLHLCGESRAHALHPNYYTLAFTGKIYFSFPCDILYFYTPFHLLRSIRYFSIHVPRPELDRIKYVALHNNMTKGRQGYFRYLGTWSWAALTGAFVCWEPVEPGQTLDYRRELGFKMLVGDEEAGFQGYSHSLCNELRASRNPNNTVTNPETGARSTTETEDGVEGVQEEVKVEHEEWETDREIYDVFQKSLKRRWPLRKLILEKRTKDGVLLGCFGFEESLSWIALCRGLDVWAKSTEESYKVCSYFGIPQF